MGYAFYSHPLKPQSLPPSPQNKWIIQKTRRRVCHTVPNQPLGGTPSDRHLRNDRIMFPRRSCTSTPFLLSTAMAALSLTPPLHHRHWGTWRRPCIRCEAFPRPCDVLNMRRANNADLPSHILDEDPFACGTPWPVRWGYTPDPDAGRRAWTRPLLSVSDTLPPGGGSKGGWVGQRPFSVVFGRH